MAASLQLTASITFKNSAIFADYAFASHPDIVILKRLYSSVVVSTIDVEVLTLDVAGMPFLVGVVPSGLAAPTSAESSLKIPHQQMIPTNEALSVIHKLSFNPPGVEYDVAQIVLRQGHPVLRVALASGRAAVGDHVATLAVIRIIFTVQCSGAAFGA